MRKCLNCHFLFFFPLAFVSDNKNLLLFSAHAVHCQRISPSVCTPKLVHSYLQSSLIIVLNYNDLSPSKREKEKILPPFSWSFSKERTDSWTLSAAVTTQLDSTGKTNPMAKKALLRRWKLIWGLFLILVFMSIWSSFNYGDLRTDFPHSEPFLLSAG